MLIITLNKNAYKFDFARMIMVFKKRFPTFALIVLVFAVVWLLKDLGMINIGVPWIPAILIIVAIGMIINRLSRN